MHQNPPLLPRLRRRHPGDLKLPDGTPETRYTVKWDHENDYPRIELMP